MCSRLEKTGLGVMVREPRSKRGGLTSEPPRKTTPWPQVGQTSRQKAREALRIFQGRLKQNAGVGMMTSTDLEDLLFQDAPVLQADALEMLAQGRIRNAVEKTWGAAKRASDALIRARTGGEPDPGDIGLHRGRRTFGRRGIPGNQFHRFDHRIGSQRCLRSSLQEPQSLAFPLIASRRRQPLSTAG